MSFIDNNDIITVEQLYERWGMAAVNRLFQHPDFIADVKKLIATHKKYNAEN